MQCVLMRLTGADEETGMLQQMNIMTVQCYFIYKYFAYAGNVKAHKFYS